MPHTDELAQCSSQLGSLLSQNHWRIATAESCTGGWIAKAFTDIAGSSDWFEGAVISYSNKAKVESLSVSEQIIESDGAVSEAVVKQMALGVAEVMGTDAAISVSGIAGPGGGSVEKPVGTVWICWLLPGNVLTECVCFPGDRNQVRQQTVRHAIKRMIDLIGQA